MKKIIFSMFLSLCFVFTAVAQFDDVPQTDPNVTNKRGAYLLPDQGDFALGFDATSLLNLFQGGVSFDQTTIFGKYFLDHDRALRVKLSLGMFNEAHKDFDDDVTSIATPTPKVTDIERFSELSLGLSLGYEMRRGHGRVQGFYGGELGFGISSASEKYEWGNKMSATYNPGPRPTEEKFGTTFSVGLGGFVGAEYFIAPKLSLGVELSLGLWFSSTGESEKTTESWEDNARKTTTTKGSAGDSNFSIRSLPAFTPFKRDHEDEGQIIVPRGMIFLTFHF